MMENTIKTGCTEGRKPIEKQRESYVIWLSQWMTENGYKVMKRKTKAFL